jgi:tripartite motif-containing protein 71
LSGSYLGEWSFYGPDGIAVAPSGKAVYAASHIIWGIQYFTGTGSYLGKWGSYGSGPGQFKYPRGVAVAPSGTVFVVDANNECVQYFTATGSFLGKWGSPGSGNGEFDFPFGVAVAPNGTVYVADTVNDRIQYFKRSRRIKMESGDSGESGVAPTSLGRLKALYN